MKVPVEISPGTIEERYFDFSYVRIVDAEDRPHGVFGMATNVTDLVKSQSILLEAKQEAEMGELS